MNFLRKAIQFYIDGFREMPSWGRQLWVIIILKLFIMFAVFRLFFFPDYLKSNFKTDDERGKHVIERITTIP